MRKVLLALLLVAAPAAAKWSVDVQNVPDLRVAVHVVAIVPITCPESVDCDRVETDIVKMVAMATGARVVGPRVLKEAAFKEGIVPPLSTEALARFSQAAGADSVMVVSIGGLSTTTTGGSGVVVGSTFVATQDKKQDGSLTLTITSLDGKLLLHGTGFGESRNPFRAEEGMVLKMARLILEKAFGR